jgi:hypothetical protein
MTEAQLIQSEVARVMRRAHPPLVMTLEDIADFCGLSYNYVRNELQNQPDFPARLDRFKSPRWSREAILAWAQVSV